MPKRLDFYDSCCYFQKLKITQLLKYNWIKFFYFNFMFWPFQIPMNENSLFISFLRTPSSGNELLGRFEILGFVNFSRNLSMRTIERPSRHLSVVSEPLQLRKQTQLQRGLVKLRKGASTTNPANLKSRPTWRRCLLYILVKRTMFNSIFVVGSHFIWF